MVAGHALDDECLGLTRFTNAGPITITGLTRMVIRKPTPGANTTRMARLSRTIQTGITLTGIGSRTSLIDIRTPGRTRRTVITNRGTVTVSDAMGSVSESARGSLRDPSLDTP